MRTPRTRAKMIGCFVVVVLAIMSWSVPSMARCNDVSGRDVEGKIFGQFSTYFRSSKDRGTATKTADFPSAQEDKRFGDSDIYIKPCDHLNNAGDGAANAALVLEKSEHEPGIFLHGSVFRLWHQRLDVIERWLEGGKAILSNSAIRNCVFESAAIELTRDELLALYGSGLRQWEALCWNGLYSGYAAIIRQDLIDGSYGGKIETRYGDNQLLVWIDIKALVD
jgi:hypothetical protein